MIMKITTGVTTVSTETVTSICNITITTNTVIYYLFLLALEHPVKVERNICSLKNFQFLAEKTKSVLVGTLSQEITPYAKTGNSI